jgi:hypothetical protein
MVVDAGRIIGRDHRQRAGDGTRVSVILVAKVTNMVQTNMAPMPWRMSHCGRLPLTDSRILSGWFDFRRSFSKLTTPSGETT